MAKTRGTGLLMVWTDIDAEFEPEFNRWYDEEHLARLLQVPGFLTPAVTSRSKEHPNTSPCTSSKTTTSYGALLISTR